MKNSDYKYVKYFGPFNVGLSDIPKDIWGFNFEKVYEWLFF